MNPITTTAERPARSICERASDEMLNEATRALGLAKRAITATPPLTYRQLFYMFIIAKDMPRGEPARDRAGASAKDVHRLGSAGGLAVLGREKDTSDGIR